MKKILMGVVWFFVLYLGLCTLGGAIVGGIAGYKEGQAGHPERATQAGTIAGAEFGRKYGIFMLLGVLVLSVAGTAAGILPGTKSVKTAANAPPLPGNVPPPLPPPCAAPREIFIARNGRKFGPYSIDDVRKYLAEGSLTPGDLEWHEGAPGWEPLSKLLG